MTPPQDRDPLLHAAECDRAKSLAKRVSSASLNIETAREGLAQATNRVREVLTRDSDVAQNVRARAAAVPLVVAGICAIVFDVLNLFDTVRSITTAEMPVLAVLFVAFVLSCLYLSADALITTIAEDRTP